MPAKSHVSTTEGVVVKKGDTGAVTFGGVAASAADGAMSRAARNATETSRRRIAQWYALRVPRTGRRLKGALGEHEQRAVRHQRDADVTRARAGCAEGRVERAAGAVARRA